MMESLDNTHPDLLYHQPGSDDDLVNNSTNLLSAGCERNKEDFSVFHILECRIAYSKYQHARQSQMSLELNRQLWVARKKWQGEADHLWKQYCAVRYDPEHCGSEGKEKREKQRQDCVQEHFDRWRNLYHSKIGVIKQRFYQSQEAEKAILMELVVLAELSEDRSKVNAVSSNATA
jgi:hypothetical protein